MTVNKLLLGSAQEIASAVHAGRVSVRELVNASLARIADTEPRINAFTDVLEARARQRAEALERTLASAPDGLRRRWPLAGVPFAAKNLFDVTGLPTLAGSKIERTAEPARNDAVLIQRLEAAGAVLVGTLNMDEYAYGFTTENSHYGATRNPHDTARIAGGSSGGSGASVAAGQVPLSLGSDTNGSIRVPSSLCGVFGLKPTFGRLPRTGSYPFVASLDHLGPFARTVTDLALTYDALQGPDAGDPSCSIRAPAPVTAELVRGIRGLRIAVLGGYFAEYAGDAARAAVAHVAQALGVERTVIWESAAAARAAAFVITNASGGALHLANLRTRAEDFEPLSRDRFLAGALLPGAWVERAQRVRRRCAREMAQLLQSVDILIAPATPGPATLIGSETMEINGRSFPTRPSMGLLAQPLSCVGLPVAVVPLWSSPDGLPIGVQIAAAPWREDRVLRIAAHLEELGIARAPIAGAVPSAA